MRTKQFGKVPGNILMLFAKSSTQRRVCGENPTVGFFYL